MKEVTLQGNQGAVLPAGLRRDSTARHPVVPTRQVALTERLRAMQILKGLYVEVDGEKYALPIDSWEDRTVFLGQKMWVEGPKFPRRVGAKAKPPRTDFHKRALAWLRDNVHQDIPAHYYRAVLGHDLHVSTFADLYAKHWHVGWASPFDVAGESVRGPIDPDFQTVYDTHFTHPDLRQHVEDCRLGTGCPARENKWHDYLTYLRSLRGFIENLGWLSGAKVTDAFVSKEIAELVSGVGTEYADFDQHEVGTSSTAENNNDTALGTTTSIARAAGTPTNADPIYRSVATITADTTETWQEEGVFCNTTGATMMDRNLTGGQAVVSTDQVQYTYELTKNAEA